MLSLLISLFAMILFWLSRIFSCLSSEGRNMQILTYFTPNIWLLAFKKVYLKSGKTKKFNLLAALPREGEGVFKNQCTPLLHWCRKIYSPRILQTPKGAKITGINAGRGRILNTIFAVRKCNFEAQMTKSKIYNLSVIIIERQCHKCRKIISKFCSFPDRHSRDLSLWKPEPFPEPDCQLVAVLDKPTRFVHFRTVPGWQFYFCNWQSVQRSRPQVSPEINHVLKLQSPKYRQSQWCGSVPFCTDPSPEKRIRIHFETTSAFLLKKMNNLSIINERKKFGIPAEAVGIVNVAFLALPNQIRVVADVQLYSEKCTGRYFKVRDDDLSSNQGSLYIHSKWYF